jgi:hypothetical protein
MRAHKGYFRNGQLGTGVFSSKEGPGMSADWDKYSSKEHTLQRSRTPSDNAVIALSVQGVRNIDALDVNHLPEQDNRGHSEINLPDKREELTEVRVLLKRLAIIVIPLTIS